MELIDIVAVAFFSLLIAFVALVLWCTWVNVTGEMRRAGMLVDDEEQGGTGAPGRIELSVPWRRRRAR